MPQWMNRPKRSCTNQSVLPAVGSGSDGTESSFREWPGGRPADILGSPFGFATHDLLLALLPEPHPIALHGFAAEGAHDAPEYAGDGVVPGGEAEEGGDRSPVEAHAAVPEDERLEEPDEQERKP